MEIETQLEKLMNQYGGPVEFLLLLEQIEQALQEVLKEVPLLVPRLAQAVQLLSDLIDVLERLFNRQ